MLNKLSRKDQAEEIYQSKSKDAVDNIKVVKKKTGKKILIYILLIFLSAGAGFTGMTLMATDNSSGKKLQGSYRQLPGVLPPPPSITPQVQQPPVLNAEGKKQRTESMIQYAEERDVFKEFYLRHAPGATLTKGPAMHLEQCLPNMTRPLNPKSGVQELPPVQLLNTSLVDQQLREVKIYGITCIGESDLFAGECAAITSDGVLKKGDKLGSETVFAVNETSFATSKRTVELN